MGCIPLMHDDDRIRLWSDPSATSLVRQCQWTSGPPGRLWPAGAAGGCLWPTSSHHSAQKSVLMRLGLKSDEFVNSYARTPEARRWGRITRVIVQVLATRKSFRLDYSGGDGLEQGQPSDRDPRA
jgi:hypothetical protein